MGRERAKNKPIFVCVSAPCVRACVSVCVYLCALYAIVSIIPCMHSPDFHWLITLNRVRRAFGMVSGQMKTVCLTPPRLFGFLSVLFPLITLSQSPGQDELSPSAQTKVTVGMVG